MAIYRTNGTCSKEIFFKVEDNKLTELKFMGGCSGNLQAITRLLIGQDIDKIIETLQGIQCRNRTSCPEQLTLALREYKEKQAEEAPAKK